MHGLKNTGGETPGLLPGQEVSSFAPRVFVPVIELLSAGPKR